MPILVLLAASVALGFLAWTNDDRADRWQSHSVQLERNTATLNRLLVLRSNSLNERTRELNAMAAKVRRASSALRRSERDVRSLARRQRELANEKAQVEDQRAQLAAESSALGSVANAYIDCKNGLLEVLQYVVIEDYDAVSSVWPLVESDCDSAERELGDYNHTYGG